MKNAEKLSSRCWTEQNTNQVSTMPSQADMSPKHVGADSIWGISTHRSRRMNSGLQNQGDLRTLHSKTDSVYKPPSTAMTVWPHLDSYKASVYAGDSMSITYTQHNYSQYKHPHLQKTLTGDSIFSNEETKYLEEVGRCKNWFKEVLKKCTKNRQSSLMKLNEQKAQSLKRIRSISSQMRMKNKFQTASFKMSSSRNQPSLLGSKSPKMRGPKNKMFVTTKMIARRGAKSKDSVKLAQNYHSANSDAKVGISNICD